MYVHLVWGTLRRQRLINVEAEAELFRTILANNALEPNLESGGGRLNTSVASAGGFVPF